MNEGAIAVIGMACRFAGAPDLERYWANLLAGVESIERLDGDELAASGVDGERLDYVPACADMPDVELFDPAPFGLTPREAALVAPEQRVLLQLSWEALEHAGYDHGRLAAPAGVFAGGGSPYYLLRNLMGSAGTMASVGLPGLLLLNQADYLATRVSYHLGLDGPSVTVQTACSTSLVAVHLAAQSLQLGECDLALAGGVAVHVPRRNGYFYREGGIGSPDGHCRAFDASAHGTVAGEGAGVVVLKRLEDAAAAGDMVWAVLRGSAIGNDGERKVSFAAPSVDGQARVLREALAVAGVAPGSVAYVEAHGTGTRLGDPIEVAALGQAYGGGREHPCLVGSVKTNIGHADAAAGVAGLIKACLALHHGVVPASLHYERPNPALDLAAGPFEVAAERTPWPAWNRPRRAAVSSFGIGGTNAHVVLEEAPAAPPPAPGREWRLLVWSARTAGALERSTDRLAARLRAHRELEMADVAHTLQVGRRPMALRRMLVCRGAEDAVAALESRDPERVLTRTAPERGNPAVVFMFPGQGAQYVDMARGLYDAEPRFRQELDACADVLERRLSVPLRRVLYPAARAAGGGGEIDETWLTQPALFAVEYALARLWMAWGVEPAAMIGHSIGEYVAACLAGVLSLDDALAVVAARGRLLQELPAGAMLSVPLGPEALASRLRGRLAVAAINQPDLCVVSGPEDEVEALAAALRAEGVPLHYLRTSRAFHSALVEPALDRFRAVMAGVELRPPARPYLSNVTGTWADAAVTGPDYWVRHLRSPVRFSDGVAELLREPSHVFLELGPGQMLSTLTLRQAPREQARAVVPTVRSIHDPRADVAFLLAAAGRLWQAGVAVDWSAFNRPGRRRVPLPSYPFERERHWIEPDTAPAGRRDAPASAPVAEADPAPAGEVEETVLALWSEVLGINGIGPHEDFFELGGHSVLAMQLIGVLRRTFPVELPVEVLFERRTPASLARHVEGLILAEIDREPPDG